jgi:hypothetical protein
MNVLIERRNFVQAAGLLARRSLKLLPRACELLASDSDQHGRSAVDRHARPENLPRQTIGGRQKE